jgi:hypothetical protein
MKKLIIFFLIVPTLVLAQELPTQLGRDWSAIEIVLSVAILLFTLVLIIIEAIIITRAKKPRHPHPY